MEIVAGFLVSIVVEVIKKYFSMSKWKTMIFVAILSLVAALVYFLLLQYGLWDTALKILLIAAGVYTFILKHAEEGYKSMVAKTPPQ